MFIFCVSNLREREREIREEREESEEKEERGALRGQWSGNTK
jgi:hypothetical protein